MTNEKKAALADGFSTTTHAYFSSTALSNSIDDAILGQQQANGIIRELRTDYAAPDALFTHVQELLSSSTQLRGFCRALQKFIERGRS